MSIIFITYNCLEYS